jgi:arylsulfatase
LTADVYADAFLEWQAERDQPWAACVNFMDAHMPVLPMEEHNLWADEATNYELRNVDGAVWPYLSGDQPLEQLRRFERLYDGAIHQADAAVGHLVRTLAERDELANTMVVITGDHGEGYGEPDSIRGMHSIGHGVAGGLVEEVLHVPLVVKFPGQTDSKIISAPATTARFPVATDAVRDGEWSHDLFVPDDAVVSSMEGINPALVRRASQYLDDLEPFRTAGQAVFVPDGDTVRKYVRWGETRHAFVCPDAQTTTELDIDPSTYEHHFVERRQADVLSDEDVEIPPDVRRQLEDLGYA